MALFLYGTLLDDTLRERIGGPGQGRAIPAVLPDHHVLRQVGANVPVIAANKGSVAHGLFLPDITPEHRARFDAYEIPWDYVPLPVTVQLEGEACAAEVYFPDTSILVSDRLWTLEDWQATDGPFLHEVALEISRRVPPLEPEAMRDQWPMMARRAAARLRARTGPAPTRTRTAAQVQDVQVDQTHLRGDFFRLAGLRLRHRTFAGGVSDLLDREVFVGTDAAIVLPYDPVNDRVLLVEQVRIGPIVRGDPQPWCLEPVAGMVDADETPAEAALREAAEEAALTDVSLEHMFSYYASPGGSTDYFHCYLGRCSLADPHVYTGGLAEESEDLRLHILPFAEAYDMIATGEVNAGQLIAMLLWLGQNRARLRGAP